MAKSTEKHGSSTDVKLFFCHNYNQVCFRQLDKVKSHQCKRYASTLQKLCCYTARGMFLQCKCYTLALLANIATFATGALLSLRKSPRSPVL